MSARAGSTGTLAVLRSRMRHSSTTHSRSSTHGVVVLLKIYVHCIDGQADAANRRITDALGIQYAEEDPGDEGYGDSEPTV